MNKFDVIVGLSIVAAASLFAGAMVIPALAQDNMSMPLDQMGNVTITMDNSIDMGNGTMTVN